MTPTPTETTGKPPGYALIDGENIDRTLAGILGGKPAPEMRPRWERFRLYLEDRFQRRMHCLFFLVFKDPAQYGFMQALRGCGLQVVLLQPEGQRKVVDDAISKTLKHLAGLPHQQGQPIVLASHDAGDFAEHIQVIAAQQREVAVIGFPEFMGDGFQRLRKMGLTVIDIEIDANVFQSSLPRLRPVLVDAFDPASVVS